MDLYGNGSSQEERNEDGASCDLGNGILGSYLNVEDNNSASTETELKTYLSDRNEKYTKDDKLDSNLTIYCFI